jgi:hypothetical protein
MKYTSEQIKSIGGKRYIKRNSKRLLLSFLLSIGWIPLVYWLITSPKFWIVVAPIGLVTLNFIWSYYQSRTQFYQKVKRHPEILE